MFLGDKMTGSKDWARAQAKLLKTFLQQNGMKAPQALCLEAVAAMHGARNWQTFEASSDADIVVNEPTAVRRLAETALAAALFEQLPAGQSMRGLMDSLAQRTAAIDQGEEWQQSKARMNELWADVKERNFCIPPAQLPPVVEEALGTMTRAMKSALLEPTQEPNGPPEVYRRLMWDWRKAQGEDLPVEDARTYVFQESADDGVYVNLTYPHQSPDDLPLESPQLSVMFEVNAGLPCAHLYTDTYGGEALLTVFAARNGELLLRFDHKAQNAKGHPLTQKLGLDDSSVIIKN
jgi:hypothetical protein